MALDRMTRWYGGEEGGHIGFSCAMPIAGKDGCAIRDLTRGVLNERGLDYSAAIIVGKRSMIHVALVVFDTKNEAQTREAYAATKAMLEPAAKLGYGEYRSHVDFMDLVADALRFQPTTPSGASPRRSRTCSIRTAFSHPASRASGPQPIADKTDEGYAVSHELKTGGDRGYLRIATEEAFATQEQLDAIMRAGRARATADKGTMSLWGFYGTSPSERTTFIRERLLDLGPLRIRAMDDAGIDKAVLAMTSPGVQPLLDDEQAKGIARRGNDILKAACETYPDRFYGMIGGRAAGCGFLGRRSSSAARRSSASTGSRSTATSKGHYLDEEQFDLILRACAEAIRN